ncbi:uncharacterized protein (TIGR04141 family) [Amycolatopsis bartoniae]|uniref:Sporadically distributed protein, TIGR04141 family n=1 Tax=Amycolatopsis bartoniae TaxID=941986 RepID=A0A8H9IPK2_9PSEU|nr:DUF6119 family protein [Amycolatopsis bartoniae]MBB2938020.1 uncharacterized protein (TIGR04141 family) [Amycolatopsis bartoniae]GHF42386.1 hypothetical protein GCM10017566_14970 [Amycolatopsis bartoniae]
MSVYRLHPAADPRDLVAPKVLGGDVLVREVEVAATPALLVSGVPQPSPVEWAEAVRSLTGVDLGFTTTTSAAALLLAADGTQYALTFGQGWRYLRDSHVDREFGLDIAVRLLDPDEIRRITRRALSAKARVDRNLVPGGQGLWAFGLREHAELVRSLTGRVQRDVHADFTYVRRRGSYRNFRFSLDCGDGLQLHLGTRGEDLLADLRELTRLATTPDVHARLAPLRWVRRLGPGHELTEKLDSAAADLLAGSGEGELGISYPARYHDGPAAHWFRGHVGNVPVDTGELTLDDLRAGLRHTAHRLATLRTSAIEGFDDEGRSLGGPVSALHWLAAEVVEPGARFVLVDGDWYRLGEQYLAHVERVVADAFADRPEWTLPPWQDAPRNEQGRVAEAAYNRHVESVDERFLCLDRSLLKTRVHPRGFEACDLLGPGNELVHVKKVSGSTGSSVLSHLFAQGLVAAESLTDRQTWERFVRLVAERDPARAATLGDRPAGLVYAIHRSDKPLRPETLFTFARSALVSAAVALTTYGIPLRIAVIP